MHRLVAVAAGLALLTVACGRDAAACTELREPLDPASTLHVLDLTDVTWQSDPPTSGPHLSVPGPGGAQSEPLNRAVQVTVLERGAAVVQYDGSVSREAVQELESLAGETAVVAPGVDLPAPIVATAWTWKLSCSSLDLDRLTEFVATRPAAAPGAD